MYITLAQNINDHTFELDQMITAKALTLNHSFIKLKSSSAADNMPIYAKIDFLNSAGSFRIYHNEAFVDTSVQNFGGMANDVSHSDLQDLRGLILVGDGDDSKLIWKDLYYNLVDSKRHSAISIPKSVNIKYYYHSMTNQRIKAIPDADIYAIELVFDVEPVN